MKAFLLASLTVLLLPLSLAGQPQPTDDCLVPGLPQVDSEACQRTIQQAMRADASIREVVLIEFSLAAAEVNRSRRAYEAAVATRKAAEGPPPGDGYEEAKLSEEKAHSAYQAALTRRTSLGLLVMEEDPRGMTVRAYAATVFSNLFGKEAEDSGGFLSSSEAFASLEINQAFGKQLEFNSYTVINLQASSLEKAEGGDVVTSSENFLAESGLTYRPPGWNNGEFSTGVVAGIGIVGFANDEEGNPNDEFAWRGKLGVRFEQLIGPWRFSMSEIAYLRDPLFKSQSRLLARGRLVISPKLSGEAGRGLGVYIEGSVNVGKGNDEARLTTGLQIDALGILRAIVGVSAREAPAPGAD